MANLRQTQKVDANNDVLYVSELIEFLKLQVASYGDAQVHFYQNGNDEVITKFIHEGHALNIDVERIL